MMTNHMTLTERLRLVATVSDLMLAGSVQVYMPPKRSSTTRSAWWPDKIAATFRPVDGQKRSMTMRAQKNRSF